eukprot:scaffold94700_cov65-Phaeocystis_antarctica.AAC.5
MQLQQHRQRALRHLQLRRGGRGLGRTRRVEGELQPAREAGGEGGVGVGLEQLEQRGEQAEPCEAGQPRREQPAGGEHRVGRVPQQRLSEAAQPAVGALSSTTHPPERLARRRRRRRVGGLQRGGHRALRVEPHRDDRRRRRGGGDAGGGRGAVGLELCGEQLKATLVSQPLERDLEVFVGLGAVLDLPDCRRRHQRDRPCSRCSTSRSSCLSAPRAAKPPPKPPPLPRRAPASESARGGSPQAASAARHSPSSAHSGGPVSPRLSISSRCAAATAARASTASASVALPAAWRRSARGSSDEARASSSRARSACSRA